MKSTETSFWYDLLILMLITWIHWVNFILKMKYLGTLPGEMDLKAKLLVTEVDTYCARHPGLAWRVFLFRRTFRAGAEGPVRLRGPFPKKNVMSFPSLPSAQSLILTWKTNFLLHKFTSCPAITSELCWDEISGVSPSFTHTSGITRGALLSVSLVFFVNKPRFFPLLPGACTPAVCPGFQKLTCSTETFLSGQVLWMMCCCSFPE